MYPIEIPTALNQLHGPTMKMGQSTTSAATSETKAFEQAKSEPTVAESITTTPKPKTGEETASKMAANNALRTSPGVVVETSPLLALLIKKGADPVQAAAVLQGIRAIEYTKCRDMMKSAGAQIKGPINKIKSNSFIKNQLGRLKELTFKNLVSPQLNLNVQIAQISASIFERAAKIAPELSMFPGGQELLTCLVDSARLEGEMEYEVLFGPQVRDAIASGQVDAEEATALVEGGEILLQAAEAGVAENDGVVATTDSDKKAMGLFTQLTSNKWLLFGGAFALYMFYRSRK